MLTQQQAQEIIGSTATDSSGDEIGRVGQVYLDDQTGAPEWASVDTGLFGASESLVPLQGARFEGGNLRLAYEKSLVEGAPHVDADQHLDVDEERRLYAHYGLAHDADAVGTADGGPTDDAMTISEERLRVGTERRETGRARLRKFVVTDTETVTVPVTREKPVVEREPITDANREAALRGPDIRENEYEIPLTAERAVVTKETVPVERVRLETEAVTENATVTEDVRHEEVATEGVDERRV